MLRIPCVPDSAKSAGLEISVDQSIGNWDWWASYTVAKATDRIGGVREARSWDQRHAFQGGLTWTDERWTASVAASVHSGWPATSLALEQNGIDPSGEPIYVAIPGPRNVLHYNTFASIDFRLSRKFDLKRGHLTAFIEVTNVLNRDNECCLDWDVTDENGTPELEVSNDYWLPLLPAIGVLWEF